MESPTPGLVAQMKGALTKGRYRYATGQTISFCGVNAHWQNGIAEKKIRDLTEQARTILLFAQNRWPVAVSIHLWPYALRSANDSLNHAPRLADKVIPVEAFTG
eukprot:scaffold39205_cov33-Attheya_sp.AAC.1